MGSEMRSLRVRHVATGVGLFLSGATVLYVLYTLFLGWEIRYRQERCAAYIAELTQEHFRKYQRWPSSVQDLERYLGEEAKQGRIAHGIAESVRTDHRTLRIALTVRSKGAVRFTGDASFGSRLSDTFRIDVNLKNGRARAWRL